MSENAGSDVFVESLNSLVNEDDMNAVLNAQAMMLGRFEKTNEMLAKFNHLSMSQFEKVSTEVKGHTAMLHGMRKDIDSIFRRIRILKTKLATEYPEAFKLAIEDIEPHEPQELTNRGQQVPVTSASPQQVLLDIDNHSNDEDVSPSQGSALHTVPSIN
ncbi:kxDL motif-containing protein 1-like [Anneissia japonica]|uniref:kxDL motif-containing protein 1-like n=1 Tax=Anneissia japonica TaxID=1529436 RepID=UPI0014255F65|nr:kxDL motif-containing protein 1-like [Anneissia japonica]XP_033108870.1 kxDL motif-containing protein 1-like [Anneissia japonica]